MKKKIVNENYKYSELTGKIIGCAMRVHSHFGNGFQELIYQKSLELEFIEAGLSFHREVEMPVMYKDHEVGTRRVDFLVEDVVMLELKALVNLEDVHLAQALNYLEAFRIDTGLLINFGAKSLQFKRLTMEKKLDR